MKNKQVEKQNDQSKHHLIEEKQEETKIKSLFCYGNEKVKKMIWSLKTDKQFFGSENGKKLMERLWKEIQNGRQRDRGNDTARNPVVSKTIIICAPSSSFWQNRKNFDHMHVFMKACAKNWKTKMALASNTANATNVQHAGTLNTGTRHTNIQYVPYSIIPKLNKSLQKGLNKQDRQKQSSGAYELSNYFKHFLKFHFFNKNKRSPVPNWNILIIDDVKTTGSTLKECSHIVENYIEGLLDKYGYSSKQQTKIDINCLTIAYEA